MININFYLNGFKIDGHALFSEKGKDIVCSAVSAIIFSSLNWFNENNVNIKKIDVDYKNNTVYFEIKDFDKENKIIFNFVLFQLKSIENEYKNYLKINIFKNKIN